MALSDVLRLVYIMPRVNRNEFLFAVVCLRQTEGVRALPAPPQCRRDPALCSEVRHPFALCSDVRDEQRSKH